MNIKEAEKQTGVSVRNIRFYEQKGLLSPSRNKENDYREYSQADIDRLKLIRALRMVDMPVEKIRDVVEGKTTLQTAAAAQKDKLEEQIKHLKVVIKFCEELSETEPENVSEVLERMDKPENRKELFNKWKQDHAETAHKLLESFMAGLLFPFVSYLILIAVFILSNWLSWLIRDIDDSLLILGVVPIGLWCYTGFKLYEKKWWFLKCILSHVIPGCVVLLCNLTLEGGLFFLCSQVFWPYMALGIGSVWEWSSVIVYFWISLGIFCLGMLIGKIAEIRQAM